MENSEPHSPPPSTTPTPLSAREELPPPEKVSIRWLVEHVPVGWWLWVAGGVVAIATSAFQIAHIPILQQFTQPPEHASEDVRKIEQLQLELSNKQQQINSLTGQLKYARMPLEGLWDYKVSYTKYFGQTTPKRYLDGKAFFLWYGGNSDNPNVGYHVYAAGGIHELGKSDFIVTILVDFFLHTDESGIPTKSKFSSEGKYLARTTNNRTFNMPGSILLKLTDGQYEESVTRTIIKITFKYLDNDIAHQTDAIVTFERPHPQ